jgi:hypothetical protein
MKIYSYAKNSYSIHEDEYNVVKISVKTGGFHTVDSYGRRLFVFFNQFNCPSHRMLINKYKLNELELDKLKVAYENPKEMKRILTITRKFDSQ